MSFFTLPRPNLSFGKRNEHHEITQSYFDLPSNGNFFGVFCFLFAATQLQPSYHSLQNFTKIKHSKHLFETRNSVNTLKKIVNFGCVLHRIAKEIYQQTQIRHWKLAFFQNLYYSHMHFPLWLFRKFDMSGKMYFCTFVNETKFSLVNFISF